MAASTYAPRLHDAAMADINVTPLVDVMLVMLVIFMITAPALTRALPMNLPVPNRNAAAPPERAELRIDAHGGYVLDGQVLSAATLRPALADLAHRAPKVVLHVAAADDAEYQGFATALSAAQDSGLGNIALGD
ncbi:ExbD/TolR family protein [Lysobacter xanthus]